MLLPRRVSRVGKLELRWPRGTSVRGRPSVSFKKKSHPGANSVRPWWFQSQCRNHHEYKGRFRFLLLERKLVWFYFIFCFFNPFCMCETQVHITRLSVRLWKHNRQEIWRPCPTDLTLCDRDRSTHMDTHVGCNVCVCAHMCNLAKMFTSCVDFFKKTLVFH